MQAVIYFVTGSKAFIFVRKTLRVRPRNRKMRSILLVRREGPAFFDEDDVCCRDTELCSSLPELPLPSHEYVCEQKAIVWYTINMTAIHKALTKILMRMVCETKTQREKSLAVILKNERTLE